MMDPHLVFGDEAPHVIDLNLLVLWLELGHVLLKLDNPHGRQLSVLSRTDVTVKDGWSVTENKVLIPYCWKRS